MVLSSYIHFKALSIIVTFNHTMMKCYTLKSTFINADKSKNEKKKSVTLSTFKLLFWLN